MINFTTPTESAGIELLAGHFHEGSSYRIVRRDGVGDWLLIATVSGTLDAVLLVMAIRSAARAASHMPAENS